VTTHAVAPDHTFDKPLYLTQPPGESETLYVVEQPGRVLRVRDGNVLDEPFLDIRDRVGRSHNERGLLGLAFHPNYQENGRLFIYYTPAAAHKNVVAEYRHAGDATDGEMEEHRRLVEVEDPEGNHNGGMVAFGPDRYLYAAMGDGGGAGDQHGDIGNGQNKSTLLGSILRLDVDAPDREFAPEDNPFAGGTPGADQIWAWGLRNAWRFSFDSETGDLYIGDVGQNEIEEIDFQPADSDGGENYGWRAYEGDDVFEATINVSGVEPGNYTGSFEMYPAEDHDRNEQILEVSDDDGIAVEGDEMETTPTPTPTPTPEPTLTPTSTPTTTPTGTPTVTRTGTSNGLVDAEADGFGVVIVVLALVVLVMYSRRRNK